EGYHNHHGCWRKKRPNDRSVEPDDGERGTPSLQSPERRRRPMGLRGRPLFELPWSNRFLTLEATTIDEMARGLEEAADELRRMQGWGGELAPEGGVADDCARLLPDDVAVAREFGFEAVVGAEDDADDPDEPARPARGREGRPGRGKSAGARHRTS